jgi:hypothetical protein
MTPLAKPVTGCSSPIIKIPPTTGRVYGNSGRFTCAILISTQTNSKLEFTSNNGKTRRT